MAFTCFGENRLLFHKCNIFWRVCLVTLKLKTSETSQLTGWNVISAVWPQLEKIWIIFMKKFSFLKVRYDEAIFGISQHQSVHLCTLHVFPRSSMKASWVWEFKINVTFFSELSFYLSTFWHLADLRQKNMFKLTFPIVNIYRQANPQQIGKCFMEEDYFMWHSLSSWQPGLITRFFIK